MNRHPGKPLEHRVSFPLSLDDHTPSGKQLFRCTRKECTYSSPAPTKDEFCHGICDHAAVTPKFSLEALGEDTSSHAVRKMFPRFMGNCTECGQLAIVYASFEHFLMGDW